MRDTTYEYFKAFSRYKSKTSSDDRLLQTQTVMERS